MRARATVPGAAVDGLRERVPPSRPVTDGGRRRRAGAAPLTRESLVDATIRIADTEGSAAVTMRRLGTELGVDPTAVYRHFRDKQALLQAAADWLVAGVFDGWTPRGDWADDLRTFILHARRRYLEHPGLLVLVASSSGPVQSEASATDRVLGMLRSGGLDVEDAVRGFEVLQDWLVAVTVLDASPQAESQEPWRRSFAALPAAEVPHLAEAAPLLYEDLDARFRFGLDLIIDGLDRRRGP